MRTPRRLFSILALLLLSFLDADAATYYFNRNGAVPQDRDFNKSMHWWSNQNGTGTFIPSDKDDDFTNNSLGSNWTYIDAVGDGQSSYSLTTNADQLTLTARGTDVWDVNNQFSGIWRKDLVGNFAVSVKVNSLVNTDGWAKAGIMVADSITDLGKGGYCIVAVSPSNGVQFVCDNSGTVGQLETGTTTGAVAAPVWLAIVKSGPVISGYYKTAVGNAWTLIAGYTPQSGSAISQVGLWTTAHNTGVTTTAVFDDWQASGRMVATGHDLSGDGTDGGADASMTVSSDATAASLNLTNYSGTLNFGGQFGLFATAYDNVDFTGTSSSWTDTIINRNFSTGAPAAGLSTDTWSIRWEGYIVPDFSEAYTFYTNCDDGTRLFVNNVKLIDDWYGHGVTEKSGTTAVLTAGQAYPITMDYFDDTFDASCQLRWESTNTPKSFVPRRAMRSGRLAVTGNANMGTTATLTAADGALEFSGGSGTQVLTVRQSQTHPTIIHSGASTLQLSGFALTTTGFEQSAGTFDFNSLNLTTVAAASSYQRRGDFILNGGGTSSFANLGGRTLTIAGHASVVGNSYSSPVNMNPGTSWTFAVTGQLNARQVSLANCNASVTAGIAHRSVDGGSNSSWTISDNGIYWNRSLALTSSTDFNKAYNWSAAADGGGIRPLSSTDDWFDGGTMSGWLFKDRDADETFGSYRQAGGQMIIQADGGDVWGATNEYAVLYRTDITGDFDVSVRLISAGNTNGTGQKVGLIMSDDMIDLTQGGYAKVNFQGTGHVEFSRAQSTAGQFGSNTDGGTGLTLPIWLRMAKTGTTVTAWYKQTESAVWTQVGSGQTPTSTAANSHIGLFACGGSGVVTAIFDQFQGGTNLAHSDNDLFFAGTAGGADANATMTANLTHSGIDFSGYSGTFDFGSYTLTASSGPTEFVSTMGVTPGSGTLNFAGSGQHGFWPKAGVTFPPMTVNGMTLYTTYGAVVTSSMTVNSGQWLSGNTLLTHQVGSLSMTGGSIHFGNNTIQVTSGNASFTGGSFVYWDESPVLAFTGTSGTQVLTPRSGATHPPVTHTGASTLQLATNDLTTESFAQSAGILDFNSRNITTVGDFTLTNGTTSTMTNLGGRTITVGGNTLMSGLSGNLLNLNPGSGWTIASTGTLTAKYATIGRSTASVMMGVPYNSTDGSNNSNWNFNTSDFSSWQYSSRIGLNTTASGANVSGDVFNFPLLVRLTASNFVFTQAKSGGADLRFQDPDGSALNYHIERWDATSKVAEIWVKVPKVDGNSDRDYITMYWGNSSAAAASSGDGVFGTYAGVWHMTEGPGGSAPQFTDASGNANHGTAQSGAAGDSVTAVIGKGFKLNGSSKYVSTATSFSVGNTFTLGVWFRTVTRQGGWLLGRQSDQTGGGGGHDRKIYMDDVGRLYMGVYPGSNQTVNSTASYNDGAWHHVVAKLSTAGMQLYVDGVQVAVNAAITTAENQNGYWRLGYGAMGGWLNAPTSTFFNGTLDGGMAIHSSLTADFIKLMYQTQKPNSTVASLAGTGLSNWAYNTKVHINTTASGANITSNQVNYPLLVRLTPANFDFSKAQSTGADLRFADSAGNLLPYEIERFSSSSKLAEIWVLVPTVYGNNNSQWIRMYWGNGSASSLSSANSVFLNSNGWVGVWHLNEDGNTATSGYKDASNVENHGTGIGFDANVDVPGAVGLGTSHASAANQGIHVPNHASQNMTAALTVQTWVYPYSAGAYRRIVGKPFTTNGAPWNQYDLEMNDAGNKVSFSLNLAGTEGGVTGSTTMSNNTWYMTAGVYDGAFQRIYTNGSQEGSTARTGSIIDYGQPLAIGKYYHGVGSNYDGIIDEVRVSNVARSADWLKLDYETMKAGSSVVTLGSKSQDYAKSVQFNFNTTSSGANVAGNVTDIPIMVRLTSSNFDFAAVRNDAADIRFIDKSGAALYHEVVEWDKGNKVGKVWVKVPQVDGNSTADFITAYYGCTACSGNPWAVKDSVWSGYNAVYHLTGSEEKPVDAASYGNHGVYSHALAVNAGINSALSPYFDGTTNTIQVANNAQLDGESVTWSFWIKTSDVGNSGTWFSSKWLLDRDLAGTNDDWALVLNNGNSRLRFSTRNNVLDGNVNVGGGAWHMVHIVKTATDKYIYVDGAQDVTVGNTDVISNDATLSIMSQDGTGNWTSGQMNDLWMHPSNRSANFIRLSYQNQRDGSTFMSSPVMASSFSSSKVFKFNTTSSGANVPGDVYNFPLLLRFTDATLIDAVQSGAPDIRFLDGDGVTWLDYQVERWDQGADKAEVWVRIPRVDGNSAADFITMYYNDVSNGTVPDGSCGSCVFATGEGFTGTWHLGEDGNTTAGGYKDATSNAYNGQGVNIDNTDDITGQIGLGQDLDGTNEYIDMTGTWPTGASKRSLSIWAKSDNAVLSAHDIIVNYGSQVAGQNFGTYFNEATDTWYFFGWGTSDLNTTVAGSTAWKHHFVTYDGDSLRYYIDGAKVVQAQRTLNTTASVLKIGARTTDNLNTWDGMVDETRLAYVVRDSNWIRLEYQTQRSDATPFFNPSPADFTSSRKFTFNTTRTGANVPGDVENIPILVRLTEAGIVDAVQNDYDDIRFLDGDGKTWLSYAVERWDKTNDVAEIWVMVPKVDGNSDRDFITLYYNDVSDGTVANGECSSCVFSASNGFAAVWHLNNAFTDATSNANNGTNNGTTSAAGAVGLGQEFNGSNQYITVANSASLNPTGPLALSAWVYSDSWSGGNRRILQKNTSDDQYILKDESDQLEFYSRNVSDHYTRATLPATGEWHHILAVADGATRTIYVDGVSVASETATGALNTTSGVLDIGRKPSGSDYFDGKLDEVRVSSAVRSADWAKLEYENQRPTGNIFWNNARPGPNNKSTLTAVDAGGSISLAWTTPLSDSTNADSVGIWVKYTGAPDSVGASGQTKVVRLGLTDSAYSYPATYPGTYYFGLAVRNSSGAWSPISAASTDTVSFGGNGAMTDTVYADTAIGSDSYTCAQARSPFTPKRTLKSAGSCETDGITDTLVIRAMPGTFSDSAVDPNSKPIVVAAFDRNSRTILGGSGTWSDAGSRTTTWMAFNDMTLRNLDLRCNVNGAFGVYITSVDANVRIEGCRIYNKDGSTKHGTGIHWWGNANNNVHISNNIIHQPTGDAINTGSDNAFNIVNNVIIGTGASGAYGIKMYNATAFTDMTIANNILYNWDYGINTASANIGVVSNNLFHLVTSGREVTTTSDANKVIKDPLFVTADLASRHAFKLLPGSPGIDAGTTSYGGGGAACPYRSPTDFFGTSRPYGTAPDIGFYEGSGYTPNPTGEFDTLTNTVSGNTVIVKNSKWKLVWDMAHGAGIRYLYDMADSTTNLLANGTNLFHFRINGTWTTSGQTSTTIQPAFLERTRARSVVKQRLAYSASADLNIYYTVHASGHVYVQAELVNLSSSATLSIGQIDAYGVIANGTTAMSGNAATNTGYGYITASSRDIFFGTTQQLDAQVGGETWTQTATTAATASAQFTVSDLTDIAPNMRRQFHFLLYVGERSLDQGKASTLHADANAPSAVSMSAGSLLHERSWQDQLLGHWTLDDGAGSTARDKSLVNANHAALTSATWVSGRSRGALRFTTSSVGVVSDHADFEAGQYKTVMLWVKPDFASMGNTAFILSKGLTTSDGWYFRKAAGANQIQFVMGTVSVTSPVLTTGTWHHLAVTTSNIRVLQLYTNGVLTAASASSAPATVNASSVRFGENAGGGAADRFAGDLDDIRIYGNEIGVGDIQSIYNQGWSARHGTYHLRADNNNRAVALLNDTVAQTRMQPAFQIDNWYGPRTPKYVYLNGVRLSPNTDYVSDSTAYVDAQMNGVFGNKLVLQLNKSLTGSSQTLFVDDDDSTGYLGEAAKMKSLAITATANDKIAIQNFSGTTFGSITSGQWYMEMDLNGWSPTPAARLTDTGFGAVNVWKAAAANPNVAVSSASSLVGQHATAGKMLHQMKFDGTGNQMMDGALGYTSPANITYTITDSSATRLSLVTTTMTSTAEGTVTFTKRWTFYPTGRIFGSINIATNNLALDAPILYTNVKYQSPTVSAWSDATGLAGGRMGLLKGDPGNHAIGTALLSIKSAGATTTAPGSNLSAANGSADISGNNNYKRTELTMQTGLFQSADVPITVNFMSDFSSNFTDSATADSLLKDSQTPAVLTALGAGSTVTNDALDFNGDGFAEGDGAYTYTASGSGVAHFKLVNTVTHFNPAFRIKSWSFGTLPEFVILDNQTLVKDYHYNAYANVGAGELIIQFNKTLKPGNHVFYIAHKTGLAVSLNRFEAKGGDGVDTLEWTTESELENLGFHVYRRVAPTQALPDSLFTDGEVIAGAGIRNALAQEVRRAAAAKAASARAGAEDSLPEMQLTPEELKALGYARITAKLIPGAEGGASSTTRNYRFIDRTAAYGTAYEYLLESVDFSGVRVQYGPRLAKPENPLETALLPNYPNPFNPVTTLRFTLKEQAKVSLVVYDGRGRLVRTLIRPDKAMKPGKYRLQWDAKDDGGFQVPSGQYFYRFSAPKYHKTRKMLLVK